MNGRSDGLFRSKSFAWLVLFVFLGVWFYTLSARTLVPTDEGRYAEMAREMAATGDFVTPRLNAVKYFEKPPLQVWVTALAFKFFGLGEWQARLWTGLCGLFGILMTWQAGRRVWNDRVGLTAALVLGSSFWWAGMGHINSLDMGLAGMMTLALAGMLIGQRSDASPREHHLWMLACWAGMALAVMSKGLIGLALPGAVLVIYTVVARDWAIWKRLYLLPGLLLFFAITAPWFILVSLKNPEFPQFFFIHEHFQRFTSNVHNRAGPWYYFIPLLLGGILPWLTMLVPGLWRGLRREGHGFQPGKLLLVWAIFIFVFFSASGSKLPSYILPIFPALALLIALHIEQARRGAWIAAGTLAAAFGAAGLFSLPMISGWTADPGETALYEAAKPLAMAASLTLLAAGLLVLWWSRRRDSGANMRAVVALAIGGFLAGQMVLMATESYGRNRSGILLVPAIQAELRPEIKLYGVGLYDQTLTYYLGRTMTLVVHPDELEFGLGQEPHLWYPDFQTLRPIWEHGPKAIAVTRPGYYDILVQQSLPMRVITRDSRRVVITNDLRKPAP